MSFPGWIDAQPVVVIRFCQVGVRRVQQCRYGDRDRFAPRFGLVDLRKAEVGGEIAELDRLNHFANRAFPSMRDFGAAVERVDQDEKRAAIWMRAMRRTRTAGRA